MGARDEPPGHDPGPCHTPAGALQPLRRRARRARPGSVTNPVPQGQVVRHTGEHVGEICPYVPILDVPVSQLGDQVVEVLDMFLQSRDLPDCASDSVHLLSVGHSCCAAETSTHSATCAEDWIPRYRCSSWGLLTCPSLCNDRRRGAVSSTVAVLWRLERRQWWEREEEGVGGGGRWKAVCSCSQDGGRSSSHR